MVIKIVSKQVVILNQLSLHVVDLVIMNIGNAVKLLKRCVLKMVENGKAIIFFAPVILVQNQLIL